MNKLASIFIIAIAFTSINIFASAEKIRTIEQIKSGCNNGNGKDCNLLGDAYLWGNGVHIEGIYEKNKVKSLQYYQKAFNYYKKSCELKKGIDCYFAGSYYRDGFKGLFEQNFSKALQYFHKSCELNISISCGLVGAYYEKGLGVKKNLNKSIKYYNKDCELGEIRSCNKIYKLLHSQR